jgi:hypothetical protein
MTATEELAAIDAEWDTDPPSSGTFGHASERRLGLRVPASCWALLSDTERTVYARAVELSATGGVLELFDGRELPLVGHTFEIDLFVPGAVRPIHAVARPARSLGKLEAFEFSHMSADDRLTLAEHLDHLVVKRASSKPPPASDRAVSPPVHWKNFVLSLKRRSKPISLQRL